MEHENLQKVRDVSMNLVNAEIEALHLVKETIQSPEYISLVNWLHSRLNPRLNHRLIITGVGKNAHIAAKISETLASLGVLSFYLNTTHASHGDLGFIGEHDVLLHISRSGKTQEMLDLISYIRGTFPYIHQVLIHANPDLAPNKYVDQELCIGKVIEGDEHRLAPTASTTALLCILDAISSSLSSLRGFTRQDFLKYHPAGALGAMLREEQR